MSQGTRAARTGNENSGYISTKNLVVVAQSPLTRVFETFRSCIELSRLSVTMVTQNLMAVE